MAASQTIPGFLEADCAVTAVHSPVVLSGIGFTVECTTVMDFDSSLNGMTVLVISNRDGVVLNDTYPSEVNGNESQISLSYSGDVYLSGFSMSDLTVKELGGHIFTINISQDVTDQSSGNMSTISLTSEASAKCVHGVASILPPIAVLVVCIATKQVMLALPFSIWFGALMIDPDWNPITSFERVWDTYYVEAIADVWHAYVICFTIFLGGLVKIMEKTGGTQGIAQVVSQGINSSHGAAVGVFAVGLLIFFDDYADCLITGYTFMPLMDKFRVSREKFSFIVDATAAPIASIAPLSSWVGFELGLINDYYTLSDEWDEGDEPGAYISFLKTIPYRFYPIFMLWFMFFTIFLNLDFGPMLTAEIRAKVTGQVARLGSKGPTEDEFLKLQAEAMMKVEPRPLNAFVPIFTVIFVTVLAYILTGINACRIDGEAYTARNIFSLGDSWAALLYSVVLGNVVAIFFALCQKKENADGKKVRLITLGELFASFFEGVGVVCEPLFGILMFAWCLNGIVTDLSLGDYMISSIGDSVDIKNLPFVSFIISGLISLFIGSSWATMSVMFPLIVPLALHVSGNDKEATIAVMGTILAGSVWGDHCSPISDTTILSSMASGCDHNDHVTTQVFYALFVAFFSAIFGDLCVGHMGFQYPYIGILLGLVLMTIFTYMISSKVPSYTPDDNIPTERDFVHSKFYEHTKNMSICGKKDDSQIETNDYELGVNLKDNRKEGAGAEMADLKTSNGGMAQL